MADRSAALLDLATSDYRTIGLPPGRLLFMQVGESAPAPTPRARPPVGHPSSPLSGRNHEATRLTTRWKVRPYILAGPALGPTCP